MILVALKSKEELIGDLLTLLQSPMMNLISSLNSAKQNISGVLKALETSTVNTKKIETGNVESEKNSENNTQEENKTENAAVGRLAAFISKVLRGKNKST